MDSLTTHVSDPVYYQLFFRLMICGQEYGSTGLDLSISKHLVSPMNGNKSMEKHVRRDEGTTLRQDQFNHAGQFNAIITSLNVYVYHAFSAENFVC